MTKDKDLAKSFDSLVIDAYASDEPGAAVLIAQGGEIIYTKGQGVANLEWQIPIEPDMVFRYGSITKQFTAIAILILMEQGKLKLDDPITNYLPDYPMTKYPITVRHLLTHTSGIKSYTAVPEWLSLWRKDMSVAEIIDLTKDEPMLFEPGEKMEYCNSGYILLGAIIEAVSEQSYAEFVQTKIFEPAGMKTAVYDMAQPIIPRRVAGYSPSSDGFVNAEYISMTQPYAAGSLAGSVYDLATWDKALYTEKLLKQETLAFAYEPFTLNDGALSHYGFGWGFNDYEGYRLISHGGGIHGFSTYAVRELTTQSFVAVLTNNDSKSPELLAIKLMAEALGKPLRDPKPISVPEDVLQSYAGHFKVDETISRKIFCEDGKLFSQLGEQPPIELIPVAKHRFVMTPNVLMSLVFVLDGDGRITAVEQYYHNRMTNRAEKITD